MIGLALVLATQSQIFQKGLASDADVLQQVYEGLHPGLYRYNTPAQMAANFANLRDDWGRCTTLRQAYIALSQFTAKVKCGHTYPNFFNQRRDLAVELFSGQNRLPCYFRWLGGRMVVLKDFTSAHVLPKGTLIEKIDGIPCGSILSRLMTIARADGSNDFKRRAYLSVTGDDRYEAFDLYFPMMFKLPPGRFTLKIQDLTGHSREVRVDAESIERRESEYREISSDRPWKLEFSGATAVLTMPSWQMYDGKWDWQGFLAESFAKIRQKRARDLVIDLRGNEGGSSVGDVLAAYLVSKPLRLERYHQYTRYAKLKPDWKPYLDTWDRSFDDWSRWTHGPLTIEPGHNLFYRMARFDPEGGDRIEPKADRFAGRVFVLVDSSNSSATFEFENLVQSAHLGVLVGEPTGGNLRGINGGAFYFLHLPNSGLEVDVPLIGQFPTAPQPDRGLIPDVAVMPTRADIAAGRDAVLRRVMRLIASAETR